MKHAGAGLWFGLAVLASMLAVPTLADPSGEDDAWLVVLQGDVEAITDGRMTLLADRWALAFTDRPTRKVRLVDLDGFVATEWSDGGGYFGNPPNASLVDGTNRTIGVIAVEDAEWVDGRLEVAFTDLRGDLPSIGDYVAITLDSEMGGFDQETGNVYVADPP